MKSVGYDVESRILEIEFESGKVYQYLGVLGSKYEGLIAAESKGAYFNREIRDYYPFVQVRRSGGAG